MVAEGLAGARPGRVQFFLGAVDPDGRYLASSTAAGAAVGGPVGAAAGFVIGFGVGFTAAYVYDQWTEGTEVENGKGPNRRPGERRWTRPGGNPNPKKHERYRQKRDGTWQMKKTKNGKWFDSDPPPPDHPKHPGSDDGDGGGEGGNGGGGRGSSGGGGGTAGGAGLLPSPNPDDGCP